MNLYTTTTELKSAGRLNISSTTYDSNFLKILDAASRQIDKYCRRHFYARTQTKYLDGAGNYLWIPDLLSVTTLKTDEDGDGTFENTFAATDYFLYGWGEEDAYNRFPKTRILINPNGDYGNFAAGIHKGVEIAGLWGYGDGESATPYDSDTTTAEELDSSETAVDVTSASNLSAGHTILVESEQMYISSITSNTLTVVRGVNSTTAATHATAKTVYIYKYPTPIAEACLIQTIRWWKRKDSAFQDAVGIPDTGVQLVYKGLDADLQLIIAEYRR